MKTITTILLLMPLFAFAFTPNVIEVENPTSEVNSLPRGNLGLKTLVLGMVEDAGFDPKIADAIIQCESSWNPDAIGDGSLGGSYGLWQIHQPAHNLGSASFDPILSTEYAIKLMQKQGYKPWSCARILGFI